MVATLGNHATKQLTGKETGITRVHGSRCRSTVGPHTVTDLPIYHPAAALYTPAMLKALEEDFAPASRRAAREDRARARAAAPPVDRSRRRRRRRRAAGAPSPGQLGLF